MAKLTNNALFATLGGVILVTLLGIAGYFISRPYVQYEEGRFYKTGTVSVVSLRLENKGYSDAELVNIEATFPEAITEITSGDAISPFTVTSGGKGFKTVGGSLPRISPSQATYVYFAVDNSSGVIGEAIPGFVRQVTFKNGKGSTDPPAWITALTYFLSLLIGALLSLVIWYFLSKYMDQSKELKEATIAVAGAKQELDELTETTVGYFQELTNRIEGLTRKMKSSGLEVKQMRSEDQLRLKGKPEPPEKLPPS